MEKLVSNLASLGVPGLVLLFAVNTSEVGGNAAVVAALVSLGPGGMLGGIATLGVISLIVHGLTEYCFESISCAVIKKLLEKGETKESVLQKISKYPISKSLKQRLTVEAILYQTQRGGENNEGIRKKTL